MHFIAIGAAMKTIEDAVADLHRAMLTDDMEALDALLADEVVYVHSGGAVEDKQAYLDAVRDKVWEYKRVKAESQCIVTSGDMAMVHAVLDFEGGKRGEIHKPLRLFTTLVWMRQQGTWKLISRQATKLA
jgi:ketosteroid isomerase-like protein